MLTTISHRRPFHIAQQAPTFVVALRKGSAGELDRRAEIGRCAHRGRSPCLATTSSPAQLKGVGERRSSRRRHCVSSIARSILFNVLGGHRTAAARDQGFETIALGASSWGGCRFNALQLEMLVVVAGHVRAGMQGVDRFAVVRPMARVAGRGALRQDAHTPPRV